MKTLIHRTFCFSLSSSLVLLSCALAVSAQKKSRLQDATRHATEASEVFNQIMNVREKAIPQELLDKAEAIAVFPDVIKAAFIIGGKGGQGGTGAEGRKCADGQDGAVGRKGQAGPTGSEGPRGPRPEIIPMPGDQVFGSQLPPELAALLGGGLRHR